MLETHYRSLEKLFHSAPINVEWGFEMEVGEGEARTDWEVDARAFHGAASLHGSMYFKMLDDAAWFAAASRVRDQFLVTASFNIHLLRPVREGRLHAIGKVTNAGRQLVYAASVLYDQRGKECARGDGIFMRSGIGYDTLEGYKA